jgi:hypothetical protein
VSAAAGRRHGQTLSRLNILSGLSACLSQVLRTIKLQFKRIFEKSSGPGGQDSKFKFQEQRFLLVALAALPHWYCSALYT